MKKIVKFNIWDYIDCENLNEILDNSLKYKQLATEIQYKIKRCDRKGNIVLMADFKLM
jgi:hypothetical protein